MNCLPPEKKHALPALPLMIINFSPQNKYPNNNLKDTQIDSKQEHPTTTTTTTTTTTPNNNNNNNNTQQQQQQQPPLPIGTKITPFSLVKPSHVARRWVQWWPCLPTRRRSWRRWKWPPMSVAKGLRWVGGRVSLSTWMWLNECLFYMLCYVFWMCWMMVDDGWGLGWGRVWMKVVGVCEEVQSIESIEHLWTQHIVWFSSKGSNNKFYIQIYCRDTVYTPLKNKNTNPEKNEPWPLMCEKRTHNKHQHHQHWITLLNNLLGKCELRAFWEDTLTKPPFGVTSAETQPRRTSKRWRLQCWPWSLTEAQRIDLKRDPRD